MKGKKTEKNRYDSVMSICIRWWWCSGEGTEGVRGPAGTNLTNGWWLACGNLQVCCARWLNMLPLRAGWWINGLLLILVCSGINTGKITEGVKRWKCGRERSAITFNSAAHLRDKNTRYGNLLCRARIWEQDAFICDLNHHLWKSNLWKLASIKHFTNALQRRGQTLPVNLCFFQRCNSATQRTGSRKRVVLMQKQDNCNTLQRLHVEPSSDTSALSSIITFLGGRCCNSLTGVRRPTITSPSTARQQSALNAHKSDPRISLNHRFPHECKWNKKRATQNTET